MKKWKYKTPGIPDDFFVRGEVPMTKEEIRSVILSKLKLKDDLITYDIGAGTGSVAIEISFQVKNGKVYAVEKEAKAINLIEKNKLKFERKNIEIIKGTAPKSLKSLPPANRVFIGGSSGNLRDILDIVNKKLHKKGIIVITAVTLNTLNSAITHLERLDYKLNICNIAVTRTKKIKKYHMLNALNPIYIITARRKNYDS